MFLSSRLVSGNFRRLNMKGKRYLRAPNTSAASVRRRQRAHKKERRMLDRNEAGYGIGELEGDFGKHHL